MLLLRYTSAGCTGSVMLTSRFGKVSAKTIHGKRSKTSAPELPPTMLSLASFFVGLSKMGSPQAQVHILVPRAAFFFFFGVIYPLSARVTEFRIPNFFTSCWKRNAFSEAENARACVPRCGNTINQKKTDSLLFPFRRRFNLTKFTTHSTPFLALLLRSQISAERTDSFNSCMNIAG